MRDQWHGDNRDLVKWGVIFELARRYDVSFILQVLYYQPSSWPSLDVDGESVELSAAVVKHFRNALSIRSIDSPVPIDIVDMQFDKRDTYLSHVVRRIEARTGRGVVFLDPDTGLESRTPGPEHVLSSEATTIWRAMRGGDVLVLYQHQTNRRGQPWIEPKRTQLETCLGVQTGAVRVAQGPELARDVALLFAQKTAIACAASRL